MPDGETWRKLAIYDIGANNSLRSASGVALRRSAQNA